MIFALQFSIVNPIMYFYRLKFQTMALKDILVISGQGGLFKYISQGRNAVIVESLSDQKRMSIPATTKISMLSDIAVFTENEDIPLREVLKKIQTKENGGTAIPHKSPDAEIKKYFAEVLPNYDKSRVYVSDIRKVVLWYNLLHELDITDFEAPEEEGETGEDVEAEEVSEKQ
jgi:hypothetical protein